MEAIYLVRLFASVAAQPQAQLLGQTAVQFVHYLIPSEVDDGTRRPWYRWG